MVDDVHAPSKTGGIIENILVGSDTLIIDEVPMSSDSTNDDVNEIIEFNIPAMPSKSIKFPCPNILLWSFLSSHILVGHLSSLP